MSRPDFTKTNGLLPAIAQDSETGDVLMLAYMNEQAFDETLRTGTAVTTAEAATGFGTKERKVVMCKQLIPSTLIVTQTPSC